MKTTMPPFAPSKAMAASWQLQPSQDLEWGHVESVPAVSTEVSAPAPQTIADFGTRISEMLHDVPATWVCLKVVKMIINHGTIRHIHVYLLLILSLFTCCFRESFGICNHQALQCHNSPWSSHQTAKYRRLQLPKWEIPPWRSYDLHPSLCWCGFV